MMIMKYDVDYDDDDDNDDDNDGTRQNNNKTGLRSPPVSARSYNKEVIPNYFLVLIMIQISHHPFLPKSSHLTVIRISLLMTKTCRKAKSRPPRKAFGPFGSKKNCR